MVTALAQGIVLSSLKSSPGTKTVYLKILITIKLINKQNHKTNQQETSSFNAKFC